MTSFDEKMKSAVSIKLPFRDAGSVNVTALMSVLRGEWMPLIQCDMRQEDDGSVLSFHSDAAELLSECVGHLAATEARQIIKQFCEAVDTSYGQYDFNADRLFYYEKKLWCLPAILPMNPPPAEAIARLIALVTEHADGFDKSFARALTDAAAEPDGAKKVISLINNYVEPRMAPKTVVPPVAEKVCPKCGKTFEASYLFCIYCGGMLETVYRQPELPKQPEILEEQPAIPEQPEILEEPPETLQEQTPEELFSTDSSAEPPDADEEEPETEEVSEEEDNSEAETTVLTRETPAEAAQADTSDDAEETEPVAEHDAPVHLVHSKHPFRVKLHRKYEDNVNVKVKPLTEKEPETPNGNPPASTEQPEPPSQKPIAEEKPVVEALHEEPKPVDSAPIAPEPIAPEPVVPEPVVPEPVAPEPVVPEPVAKAEPVPARQETEPPIEGVLGVTPMPTAFGETTLLGFTNYGETAVLNGGMMGNAFKMPCLIRKSTNEKIFISKRNFIIGKSKEKADYTVTNNNAISRVHCKISVVGNEYFIVDMKSTNHTYVNNEILQPDQPKQIYSGDEVKIANEEFTFSLQ